jgi:hypothetical protein
MANCREIIKAKQQKKYHFEAKDVFGKFFGLSFQTIDNPKSS